MRIGNLVIEPWNKRNFIWRLIALGLVLGWVGCLVALQREIHALDAQLQARQLQAQQQEERQRRAAAYERSRMEQRLNRNQVKNAVDNFRR